MAANVREYPIYYPDGQLAATHVRVSDGPRKRMFWVGHDGMNGLPGISVTDLPLYRSDVIAQRDADIVILTEGEKAADAVADAVETVPTRLTVVAAGTVTGASSTPSVKSLEVLHGRIVLLWPDADAPGIAHMARIRDRLRGIALGVYRVDWQAPHGMDAADVPAHVIRAAVMAPRHW